MIQLNLDWMKKGLKIDYIIINKLNEYSIKINSILIL